MTIALLSIKVVWYLFVVLYKPFVKRHVTPHVRLTDERLKFTHFVLNLSVSFYQRPVLQYK